MGNPNGDKGREAENGVRDYLNSWYPEELLRSQGEVWSRARGKGVNDEGDVFGPFTAIEVKNYTKPPVSGLLDNATKKGKNAGRHLWFLVYKRKGFSSKRAGAWNAMTTVEALYKDFGVRVTFDQEVYQDSRFFTVDEALARTPDLCASNSILGAKFNAPVPTRSFPRYVGRPLVVFSSFMRSFEKNRDKIIQSLDLADGHIPLIVHPRPDRPVEQWYVWGSFYDFALMLESLGVQPQDEQEREPWGLLRDLDPADRVFGWEADTGMELTSPELMGS